MRDQIPNFCYTISASYHFKYRNMYFYISEWVLEPGYGQKSRNIAGRNTIHQSDQSSSQEKNGDHIM